MIYLQLFLNFLMIGALSFGGGYGMISLVRETVLRYGWLTEAEFLPFPSPPRARWRSIWQPLSGHHRAAFRGR